MFHTTSLTIATTQIRQDSEGRFCLNDCHRASGGNPKDAPAQWLRAAKTKGLIGELGTCAEMHTSITTINDGKNNGTYARKELIYAYAMWISPTFHLHVIRAFDDLVQGKTTRPKENVDTTLPLRRARLAFSSALHFNQQMGMEVGMARLKALTTAQAQTGIDVARAYGWQTQAQAQPVPYQERTLNATEIGKHFGTNARGANQLLKNMGYQTDSRDAKDRIVWTPTEKGRPYARLEDQTKAHTEGTVQQWRWYPSILEALKGQGGIA